MSVLKEVHFTPEPPPAKLPMRVWLDDTDSAMDVIDALALSPFATGEQPWSRSTELERVRPEAPLAPAGAKPVRAAREDNGREARLMRGEGWTLRVIRYRNRAATVSVTAVNDELARTVLEEAVKDAVEPVPESDHVEMGFWWHGPQFPRRSDKPITTSPWSQVTGNYAASLHGPLSRLMAITPAEVHGRLILLHGPPGTGKTTLLRTLAREWRSWCQADCVLDPERLFNSPGYLMEVAVGSDDGEENDSGGRDRKWRLLILEDCDELIGSGAKEATGQGLSRLLNLTDGLLGHGRDVLVAITTNENLARLHPAVTRPGRCLAQIEVGALPHGEASRWLGTAEGVPSHGATLAELFALREGVAGGAPTGPETVGLYL